MTRRGGGGGGGGGFWGGSEPDLTRRPGSEGPTLRRIAGFFRPYRARLAFIAVLILITVGIGVVNPILLGLAIDNLVPGGDQDLGLLFLQCGLMILLPIVTSALGVWQSYLSNVVGQRVMNDLRLALYRHLQWMPLRFFTETRTGEIQSRIANDVGGVQSVVTDTAASVLSNVATVATTVIAMCDPRLASDHPEPGPDADLRLHHLPRRQGPAGGQHAHPALDGRDERHHRGVAERVRDPAVEDVRAAGGVDRALPCRVAAPRRPSDPRPDDRPLVLRADRHLLQHHAGLRLPSWPGG